MMALKTMVTTIRTDWKAMALFWSMVVCLALIMCAVAVITCML